MTASTRRDRSGSALGNLAKAGNSTRLGSHAHADAQAALPARGWKAMLAL
jgi:hypothetical protein